MEPTTSRRAPPSKSAATTGVAAAKTEQKIPEIDLLEASARAWFLLQPKAEVMVG